MEKLLDCIPHMIAICTKSGTLITANAKWKEYSGLSEVDPHTSWLETIHPDDVANTR